MKIGQSHQDIRDVALAERMLGGKRATVSHEIQGCARQNQNFDPMLFEGTVVSKISTSNRMVWRAITD